MKNRKKNVFLLVGVILATFVLLELLLRLFLPAYYGIPPYTFIEDEELDYVPNPNFQGVVINEEHVDREIIIEINKDGFRDKEFTKEKETVRLITLGDSETFPDTLQLKEQYGKLVEKGADVETINLGVSGYGTKQSFEFFKRVGKQYNPDIVTYLFVPNDLTENIEHRYTIISGARVNYDWKEKQGKAKLQVFVYRNSYIAREIYRIARGRENSSIGKDRGKLAEEKWFAMREIVQEMQTYFTKNNIRFIVIIDPLEDDEVDKEIESRMVALLKELNVEYSNPTAIYKEKGGREVFRWEKDTHLNQKGHELLANAIINHLSL